MFLLALFFSNKGFAMPALSVYLVASHFIGFFFYFLLVKPEAKRDGWLRSKALNAFFVASYFATKKQYTNYELTMLCYL